MVKGKARMKTEARTGRSLPKVRNTMGGMIGWTGRLSSAVQPGSWLLAPGSWLLAPGSWLLAPGSWLLAPGSWLLAPGSWLLAPGSWLLAPGSWLLEFYAALRLPIVKPLIRYSVPFSHTPSFPVETPGVSANPARFQAALESRDEARWAEKGCGTSCYAEGRVAARCSISAEAATGGRSTAERGADGG